MMESGLLAHPCVAAAALWQLGPGPPFAAPFGRFLRHRTLWSAMSDFAFKVNIVAVVRVRAAEENAARKVVRTVLAAPGTSEIRLANENNAVVFKGALVTDVDFLVEKGSIKLVETNEAPAPAPAVRRPRPRVSRRK